MQRLIYVSESKIRDADVDAVIAQIVTEAQQRNTHFNITGALIFTGIHFAQVLEGSHKAVDELMLSICNDARHGAVSVVERSPTTERLFSHWTMGYKGPSQFVSRHVTRLFHTTPGAEQKRATEWLIQLAHEFVKP